MLQIYRYNDPVPDEEVDLELSYSNKSPTKANTNRGIKTKVHSYSMEEPKSHNHKVFKESKSFDVSTLNVVDLDESIHMSRQRLIQCPQDLSDTLSRSPSAYSKGRLFIDKNRPLIPKKMSEQLQQSKIDPR